LSPFEEAVELAVRAIEGGAVDAVLLPFDGEPWMHLPMSSDEDREACSKIEKVLEGISGARLGLTERTGTGAGSFSLYCEPSLRLVWLALSYRNEELGA
jgi:hypothetical protein